MENVGDSRELMHKLETIVSLVKELKNGLKRKLEGNFKSFKKKKTQSSPARAAIKVGSCPGEEDGDWKPYFL